MNIRLVFAALFLIGLPALAAPLHVIVDPGHGGSDNGTVQNGQREADISLSIAKYLKTFLDNNTGFQVTLTRQKDQTVSLQQRSRIAEEKSGRVFVSIHVNSAPTTKARGTEIYFKNDMPADEESLYLANRENAAHQGETKEKKSRLADVPAILDDLRRNHDANLSLQLSKDLKAVWSSATKTRTQSIRQAPFHVLSEVPMPSTLIEVGYLTNPEEAIWLAKKETHRQVAEIIYKALLRFKERLDKVATPRL